MNIEDTMTQVRTPLAYMHSDVASRKNQDFLVSATR